MGVTFWIEANMAMCHAPAILIFMICCFLDCAKMAAALHVTTVQEMEWRSLRRPPKMASANAANKVEVLGASVH